jgi:hypothetical protein
MKTKHFLLYIDVLGYDKFPKIISEKTGLEEDFIREKCIRNPVLEILNSYPDCKMYPFTDNFLITSTSFENIRKILKEITSLTLPTKEKENIPFEIAIGVEHLEVKIELSAQDSLISFLKNNLLENYKKLYKKTEGSAIMKTFVVMTNQFYNELPEKTRMFCNMIEFEDKNYFEVDSRVVIAADDKYLDDFIMINNYVKKINEIALWSYFEIKIFFIKNLNDQWIYNILYINLLDEKRTEIIEGFETDHCLLLHQVLNIEKLEDTLNRIFIRKDYLENSNSLSFADFPKSFDYSICKFSDVGVESPARDYQYPWPAYSLKMESSKLIDKNLEMIISSELGQNYIQLKKNPTILSDAVKCFFPFWDLPYSSFVLLFAPIHISIPKITLHKKSIKIEIPFFNAKINPLLFKLKIGGRIRGRPSRMSLTIEDFRMTDTAISRIFEFSEPLREDALTIRLYYKKDLLYETEIVSNE